MVGSTTLKKKLTPLHFLSCNLGMKNSLERFFGLPFFCFEFEFECLKVRLLLPHSNVFNVLPLKAFRFTIPLETQVRLFVPNLCMLKHEFLVLFCFVACKGSIIHEHRLIPASHLENAKSWRLASVDSHGNTKRGGSSRKP